LGVEIKRWIPRLRAGRRLHGLTRDDGFMGLRGTTAQWSDHSSKPHLFNNARLRGEGYYEPRGGLCDAKAIMGFFVLSLGAVRPNIPAARL
jgi:hypothetical protein